MSTQNILAFLSFFPMISIFFINLNKVWSFEPYFELSCWVQFLRWEFMLRVMGVPPFLLPHFYNYFVLLISHLFWSLLSIKLLFGLTYFILELSPIMISKRMLMCKTLHLLHLLDHDPSSFPLWFRFFVFVIWKTKNWDFHMIFQKSTLNYMPCFLKIWGPYNLIFNNLHSTNFVNGCP